LDPDSITIVVRESEREKKKIYDAVRTSSQKVLKNKSHMFVFNPKTDVEYGQISDSRDFGAGFAVGWDDRNLYLYTSVTDDKIVEGEKKEDLYKYDCIELFLSADSDILVWGEKTSFQIGFSPSGKKYSFFQDEDPGQAIGVDAVRTTRGYDITASISWDYLGVDPERGRRLGMSVAVRDIDRKDESGKKLNWAFRNTPMGIELGSLVLQ